MAPKFDFGNSMANDFGSGNAFAIKMVKGNGVSNQKNTPISKRKDSGSPTNQAGQGNVFGQANQASPTNSKLTLKASNESSLHAQTPNLRRMDSGGATLGVKESDEEIDSEGSEDEVDSRRSGRSNGSANSEGSYSSSKKSGGSRSSGSRRPETSGGRTARPVIPQSQPKPTRLTRSALTSLHIDGIRRTPHEETLQLRTAKARTTKTNKAKKEKKEKKSKEAKKKVRGEIRVEIDHKRGTLIRRGLYRDGTKPWQQKLGRFGDPQEDLLRIAGVGRFYERVKRSFCEFF